MSETLKDANIQRIYVTQVRRAQQTAVPIAQRLNLKPMVIAKEDIDALVSQVRTLGSGETVLVVGHADTVLTIVERLCSRADARFSRQRVCPDDGGLGGSGWQGRGVTLRYGIVTP